MAYSMKSLQIAQSALPAGHSQNYLPLILLLWMWLFWTSESSARPLLRVGIGYSDQVNKSPQGSSYTFEVLMTYQLLTELGYEVNFVTAPYAKLTELLKQHQLDIATRQSGSLNPELYYSSPYSTFNNQVFALHDFSSAIQKPTDLNQYRIVAFQNASKVLGPEFYQVSQQNNAYQELLDHTQAIQMLLKQRTELVVMDKNTFYRRLAELNQPKSLVKSFDMLQPVQYRLGFYQPELQQQVEALLLQWQTSGRLAQMRLQARLSATDIEHLLRSNQY